MKKEKQVLNPSLLFIILSLIVVIISGILAFFNVEANYFKISELSGELLTDTLSVTSLFNRRGIQYVVGNMASNFVSFSPLSMIIIGLMSVGVMYRSGFLKAIFHSSIGKLPKKFITFLLILLGIVSSVVPDVGYIFLLPLAGYIFTLNNRNPLIGISAVFAGITFGTGANIVLSAPDATLLKTSREVTNLIYNSYNVNLYGSIIFMIVASFVLAYIGTLITEKLIPKKFGKYMLNEEVIDEYELDTTEKRGLRYGFISMGIILAFVIYSIIPYLPFSGLLLDLTQDNYIDQLFGKNSFFAGGIVFIIAFIFAIGSLMYLKGSKKGHSYNYFIKLMAGSLENIGSIMILIFFASQFIAIFKETNIGPVCVGLLGNLISGLNLSGIALILLVLGIILIANILVPTTSSKWIILAPVIIPSFIDVNMSPEFAQIVYKAGDSITNGLTPVLAYFVIYIGLLEMFKDKNTKTIGISKCLSVMWPYSLFLGLTWAILLIIFYLVGLPIGPGIFTSL